MDRWQGLADSLRPNKTLIVNLFGGPGVGKSTIGALTFGFLKAEGVNAEFVPEFAKSLVWAQRMADLEDQTYIFAKQARMIHHLQGKVDVIVTDAPILLSLVYSQNVALRDLVRETHNGWYTLNVVLKRNNDAHPYKAEGRYQRTVEEAERYDRMVLDMLARENAADLYLTVNDAEDIARSIASDAVEIWKTL